MELVALHEAAHPAFREREVRREVHFRREMRCAVLDRVAREWRVVLEHREYPTNDCVVELWVLDRPRRAKARRHGRALELIACAQDVGDRCLCRLGEQIKRVFRPERERLLRPGRLAVLLLNDLQLLFVREVAPRRPLLGRRELRRLLHD